LHGGKFSRTGSARGADGRHVGVRIDAIYEVLLQNADNTISPGFLVREK
jgi:hypothetical protein